MHLVEAVSRERVILYVQIGSQGVRQVHAHLLRALSQLHHVYLMSCALYQLMHLVEAVSRERGILEVQIGSQRVRQVNAHLLSGFSLLHIFILRVMLSTNWYTWWRPYLVILAS